MELCYIGMVFHRHCAASTLRCIGIVLHRHCAALALCCIVIVLHRNCAALALCFTGIALHRHCAALVLCCIGIVLHRHCPASALSCIGILHVAALCMMRHCSNHKPCESFNLLQSLITTNHNEIHFQLFNVMEQHKSYFFTSSSTNMHIKMFTLQR